MVELPSLKVLSGDPTVLYPAVVFIEPVAMSRLLIALSKISRAASG